MSKKERNQEIESAVEKQGFEISEEEQPLFETEAYGSPQPDAGSDVTVTKAVGIGGPVPIVAPKHNTIQLQPIIVPLAVVPYMTQDSNVLRTDGKQAQYASETEYYESTHFDSLPAAEPAIKKKNKAYPRVFALITFILSVLVVLPFILAYFDLGFEDKFPLKFLDVIGIIMSWAKGTTPRVIEVIYIVTAILAAIGTITSLIALVVGKYPRAMQGILNLLTAAPLLSVLIYEIVKMQFVAADEAALILIVTLSLLNLLLTIVFSIVLNKREDKAEAREYNEI